MTAEEEWIEDRACVIWEGNNKETPFSECREKAKELYDGLNGGASDTVPK